MKIEQKPLDDHQMHFSVEVEKQALEGARQKAARKIAQRVKIPGFRPGKAPFNVVEKQVGPEAIKDEAIDIVLNEMYPKVIEEAGIRPYSSGTLEKVYEDKDPLVFEFRVPLSPEVTLGDYQKIRLPFEDKPVTQEDIEDVFKNLREQNAVLAPVQRPVQAGDMAYVLMSAERQTPDKEGNTALLNERRYPVVVEAADVDTKSEWPFPGFSQELVGMQPGEEKAITHTFAADSDFEDLRNETASFKVKLEEIKDRQLPELDDAFAQSVGSYQTLADLRAEIEKQLTENYSRQAEDAYETQVVEKLLAESEIKFPPQMLHHEIHHFIEDMEPDLAARGMDMETYLKSRQMTFDQLEEEVSPQVEERMKKSLVIMEVSRQEEIEVGEEEVQGLVEERIARLGQSLNEEQMKKVLAKDNLPGLVNRIVSEEVIRRTLERLRLIAQGQAPAKMAKAEKNEEPVAEQAADE
ncbi:MAG: trigger factor [Anaerolineales bacterium]|nr:trigger factor [Anaerolineales bacterium]